MSLLIFAYRIDETDHVQELPGQESTHQLGGFEVDRRNIYGSDVARSLGLTLLPTLLTDDLYATGDDLDKLEREVDHLMENVHLFGDDAERVTSKLANIRIALSLARAVEGGKGGVYIG